jgi:hypothetical protein
MDIEPNIFAVMACQLVEMIKVLYKISEKCHKKLDGGQYDQSP